MTMLQARIAVVLLGIALPFISRLLGGESWFLEYANLPKRDLLISGLFNAISWGSILAITFTYKRASSILAPALLGFGFLGLSYYSINFSGDVKAGLNLIFMPMVALAPIIFGGYIGHVLEENINKRAAA